MADHPPNDDRIQAQPGEIHPDQVALILAACEAVMSSPGGCGEVTIKIDRGRIRFVQPAPSLDAYSPERERKWLRHEQHAKGK